MQALREDGIVVLSQLVSADLIRTIHDKVLERVTARVSFNGAAGSVISSPMHKWVDLPLTLDPGLIELATHREVLPLVDSYLCADAVLSYAFAYRSELIPKQRRRFRERLTREGAVGITGFHSDQQLVNRGHRYVGAMWYLADVGKDCGGFAYVRGSHTYASSKRDWSCDQIPNFERDSLVVEAPAGSVILFDQDGIHRAEIPSKMPRVVFRCV